MEVLDAAISRKHKMSCRGTMGESVTRTRQYLTVSRGMNVAKQDERDRDR